jgi:predicted permease
MVSFRVAKAKIRGLFMRSRLEQRLDEELQTHIDLIVEEEMRRGISAAEARRIARLRLGGLDQTKESVRDARAFWLESSWKDLCYAWRRVSSTPLFSIFAVLTLALGIGATTAIYSIIHSVLGPPPGVRDIESIVNVYHWPGSNMAMNGLSYGDYLDFRSRQTVFQDVTAWSPFRPSFTANGQSETSFGEIVDGSYFHVLGVNAELGRTLQPADAAPGSPLVVVISHGVLQHMFGGSPDIIGRTLKINGRNFEIVGVAPAAFCGLSGNGIIHNSLWVPLGAGPSPPGFDPNDRSQRWLRVKGRLRPGRTMAEAAAEIRGIGAQLDLAFPIGKDRDPRMAAFERSRKWSVRSAAEVRIDESLESIIGPMTWTIMAAVILVLLVACTNIANLMLARASGRRHELAVRLALGASRGNLVRGLLAECGIIAGAGGVVGIGVARVCLFLLGNDMNVSIGIPLHLVPRLDFAVIVVSAFATMLALIVAGLVPALQSTRADLRSVMATDGFHGAGPRWRGRRVLIAAQVAVSVILLSITALCVSQVRQQSHANTGFEVEPLALALVDFASQGYEESRVRQIVGATLQQMANRPDVDAVAATSGLPPADLSVSLLTTPYCWLDRSGGKDKLLAVLVAGTPGVFRTLGISIKRGRAFNESDTKASAPVIVVNETAARKLFGTDDVIGRELNFQRQRWGDKQEHPVEIRRVIGVAADYDNYHVESVYLPLDQHYEGFLVLSVRANQKPDRLVGPLRQSLRSVDPEVAVAQAGTGPAIVFGPSELYPQIMAGVAGALGSLALVLALAGLYGVLSHVVARRTWEVGVRMALGASPGGVIGMVLWDGLRPVIFGILAGTAVGAAARVLIQPQFARMLPQQNVIALISVPILLLTAGFAACYLPAQRAARINPNAALREL